MRLIPFAGMCPHTLMPLSHHAVYRRAVRRAQIQNEMARVAKASESELPDDERRQVIDVRAGIAACREMAVACACAAPVAVIWIAGMLP